MAVHLLAWGKTLGFWDFEGSVLRILDRGAVGLSAPIVPEEASATAEVSASATVSGETLPVDETLRGRLESISEALPGRTAPFVLRGSRNAKNKATFPRRS